MPVAVSIADIADAFPDFRVAVVIAEGLTIARDRPAELDRLIAEREEAARERWRGQDLAKIPGVAAWRAAYRAFGIKQTRYRSAIERIMKNLLAGRALARINAFVDLYNAVSLAHVLPLGADDLDKVVPPLAFRYAHAGDTFVDMADLGEDGEVAPEQPAAGEVVYADSFKILCRRWNWRQDARSLITPATTRVVVTLQSNGWGDVEAAAEDLGRLIERFCGGASRRAVLAADRRNVDL